MTPFQGLYNRVLGFTRKKKYYSMHYMMWDYIVAHLQTDSEDRINDTEYITKLKEIYIYIKAHYHKQVFLNCFLCDLHYDTIPGHHCGGCPLYNLYGVSCANNNPTCCTVNKDDNERVVRVEAAKKIRNCVLRKGGLR